MKLYQEIIILQTYFKGKFVVENVKSYYDPLIKPVEVGRHYFWANFRIGNIQVKGTPVKGITGLTAEMRMKKAGYNIIDFHGHTGRKETLFKNCVEAEIGEYLLNCARNIEKESSQQKLF